MQVKLACYFCIRKIWQLLAVTLVLLAVLVSIFRYSLPYANEYKHDLEALINEQFDVDLRIGSITASWEGTGPSLVLEHLTFDDNSKSPISLHIDNTSLQINIIDSLRFLQFRSDYFILEGFKADVDVSAWDLTKQQTDIEFEQQALIESLFLGDSGHFAIRDSRLNLKLSDGKVHTVLLQDVIWQNNVIEHHGSGIIGIPGITDGLISADLSLTGESFSELAGDVFIQASQVDLKDWLLPYLNEDRQHLHSDINGQMWLSIAQGHVENVQLNMQPSHIIWQDAEQEQKLSLSSAQVLMSPSESGWLIEGSKIRFMHNQQHTFSDINFVSELTNQQELWFKGVDLSLIDELLQLTNIIDTDLVADLSPQGVINGKLLFAEHAEPEIWLFSEQVSWQFTHGIPATSPLRLEAHILGDKGSIEVYSKQGQLYTGEMFVEPIIYDQLSGQFHIYKYHDSWFINSDTVWLDNSELTIAAEMQLRLLDEPELDLYAEIYGGTGSIAKRYLPQTLMSASLIDYLNRGIVSGQHLGSQVLLSGKLVDFPFIKKTGRFEVLSHLSQTEFVFAPDWPAVKEAQAKLHFINEGMDIYVAEGQLINQTIDGGVQVTLENLEHANNIFVDINESIQAQTLRDFFMATPLKDPLSNIFDVVQIQGEVTGDIRLDIDLTNLAVNAIGKVALDNNLVHLAQPGMQLAQVHGELHFNNEKIKLEKAKAAWLDMPINFSVEGQSVEQTYQVDISSQLLAQSNKLLPYGSGIIDGYLFGETLLNTQVQLNFAPQGFSFNATFDSDLVGINSQLPSPYSKDTQSKWPFSGQIRGDEISNLITANIKDRLFFNAILDNESGRFSNTHIIAAQQDLGLAQQDFQVSIDLSSVDLIPWVDFIDRLIDLSAKQTDEPQMLPRLNEINARIDTLTVSDIPFNDFEMRLTPQKSETQIRLNAKELRATVLIPERNSSRPINIDSDFLRLNLSEESSDTKPVEPESIDSLQWLTRMPAIEVFCADCKIKNYQLDKVSLSMFGDGEKFNISELVVDKQDHVFRGQGSWQTGITELSGIMNSRDIGELLSEFDLTSSIKDSEANMQYQLSWQGAPYQIYVPSLTGEIQWELGEGHLSEISDKGSRVFSLLSLDSLVRKLKLDFRDVFSKGFFYNSMEGSLQIANGVAYTKDTSMDGVPADLTIQGFANLDTQEINYDLSVAPQVTSSLPVIVGWMVNPVTGIAALALDKVLHSARVISEIKFKVTGTMQEPKVNEIDRKSREIEISKPAQSEPPTIEGQRQPTIEGSETLLPLSQSKVGIEQSAQAKSPEMKEVKPRKTKLITSHDKIDEEDN